MKELNFNQINNLSQIVNFLELNTYDINFCRELNFLLNDRLLLRTFRDNNLFESWKLIHLHWFN